MFKSKFEFKITFAKSQIENPYSPSCTPYKHYLTYPTPSSRWSFTLHRCCHCLLFVHFAFHIFELISQQPFTHAPFLKSKPLPLNILSTSTIIHSMIICTLFQTTTILSFFNAMLLDKMPHNQGFIFSENTTSEIAKKGATIDGESSEGRIASRSIGVRRTGISCGNFVCVKKVIFFSSRWGRVVGFVMTESGGFQERFKTLTALVLWFFL